MAEDIKNIVDIHPDTNPDIYSKLQRISKERTGEEVRPTPVLEAKNVVKCFGKNKVIPGLSFVIDDIVGKSEIVSLIGPSGCGKSTILNLIAGLIEPTEGEMFVGGKKVKGPGLDRGMVFQKYSSFPFLTVLDNISYPLVHVKKMSWATAREEAKYWVDKMYLTNAEYKFPYELSGGMQQRVAIARTLCMNAKIVLMDEPFGALDRKIRWEMQDLMAEILFMQSEHEYSVIIVTHDIPEAVFLGDRIWVAHKGMLETTQNLERPNEPARIAQGRKEFQDVVAYFNEKIDSLDLKDK